MGVGGGGGVCVCLCVCVFEEKVGADVEVWAVYIAARAGDESEKSNPNAISTSLTGRLCCLL